jgi:hypothetical protein
MNDSQEEYDGTHPNQFENEIYIIHLDYVVQETVKFLTRLTSKRNKTSYMEVFWYAVVFFVLRATTSYPLAQWM